VCHILRTGLYFLIQVQLDAANHHTRSNAGYETAEAANDGRGHDLVLNSRHQLIQLLQNLLLGDRRSPDYVRGYVLVGHE
jgi:hypothetical protein